MEDVCGDELFEFFGVVFEALGKTGETDAALFDDFLVGARDDCFEIGHDLGDCGEAVKGDVSTAVCGGCDGRALDVCGEKVEVHETGRQATFSDNRRRILD